MNRNQLAEIADNHFRATTPVYNASIDAIELISPDGEVLGQIPRDAIIKMLGMFPAESPLDE